MRLAKQIFSFSGLGPLGPRRPPPYCWTSLTFHVPIQLLGWMHVLKQTVQLKKTEKVITNWSPGGHQVVTGWFPSGHQI